MPSTNRNTWPRFAAINAGIMELLVIGWHIDRTGTWGFVNVAASILANEYGSLQHFGRIHKQLELDETRQYRSAGADQVRLSAPSIRELTKMLAVPAIQHAAALLTLRVMRTRPTIYSKFHCPGLADSILTSLDS